MGRSSTRVTAMELQIVRRSFRWFVLTPHFAILESKMQSDLKEPVPASVLDWERRLKLGLDSALMRHRPDLARSSP